VAAAKRLSAALLLALALAACRSAGPEWIDGPTPQAELLAVERERLRAMIAGDGAALEALLADDLTYTHSTGRVDSKAELIRAIASGRVRYRSIRSRGPRVRVYGATAVVTGPVDMELTAGGEPIAARSRFTATYVRRDRGWRLVAYQSTPRPPD